MKKRLLFGVLGMFTAVCLWPSPGVCAEALSAYQIVKKSEALMDQAKDSKNEMLMTLIDKRGNKRERKLLSYAKNYPDGSKKALIIFEAPADVKGTSFLVWSNEKKDDQQWLYLPALQRVRQVTSSSKGDSFMGSEFSFYDMGTRNLDKNTYKLLKEEAVDGQACYVIESIPNEAEFYGKVVTWIRKENFVPAKMQFYDTKGAFLKEGTMTKIISIKGINTPTHIEMKNAQNGRATILDLSNIQYDSGLSDDIFTQRYMQRGR